MKVGSACVLLVLEKETVAIPEALAVAVVPPRLIIVPSGIPEMVYERSSEPSRSPCNKDVPDVFVSKACRSITCMPSAIEAVAVYVSLLFG